MLLLPAVCSAGFDTWWVPDTVGGRWGNSAFQLQDIAWPDTACMDGNGCVRGSADFWWVFTAAALIWSPYKLLPCIWGGTVATVQLSSECRQPLAVSIGLGPQPDQLARMLEGMLSVADDIDANAW